MSLPVEEHLCELMRSRRDVGLRKYGIGVTERADLSTVDWCQHAIEEALDFAIYLEKLKRTLRDNG